jgi:ABC-type Na+ efflux pump permease subunit
MDSDSKPAVTALALFSRIMAAVVTLLGLFLTFAVVASLGAGGMRLQSTRTIISLLVWMGLLGFFWVMVVNDWPRRLWNWLRRAFLLA